MRKIRFATIGTSAIVNEFLQEAKTCESFLYVGAYSRDKKRARELAKPFGAVKFYDSIERLSKDSDIDAVYIASPNSLHYEQTIAMLQGQKHVLCEKPFAANKAQAQEMLTLAKQNPLVCMEAMRSLYDPAFTVIKNNLHKLGPIRMSSFLFCQFSSRYTSYKNGNWENRFSPEMAGGALMDLGIYCVEPMIYLFGEPLKMHTDSVILNGKIDGAGSVIARYDSHLVNLHYSKISKGVVPSTIQGEKGTMLIEAIDTPKRIEIVYQDGEKELLLGSQEESNMSYEIKGFLQAISGKYDIESRQEVTLLAMKLIDTIKKEEKRDGGNKIP